MFTTVAGFREQYEDIKRGAMHGGESVLVLVAPDADALCACRMLVSMLRTDLVAHKVLPVSSYLDLGALSRDVIAECEELRSIILVNCGGVVNLQDLLSLNDNVRCYVFDSHRPFNLDNLFGNHQVMVFDDHEVEDDLQGERIAYEETEFQESDEESGTDDDDRNAGDEDVNTAVLDQPDEEIDENEQLDTETQSSPIIEREDGGECNEDSRLLSVSEDMMNDAIVSDTDNNFESSLHSPPHSQALTTTTPITNVPSEVINGKRKRDIMNISPHAQTLDETVNDRKSKRERRRAKQRRRRELQRTLLEYYAEGSYYGMSVSEIMYMLADRLNRKCNEYLWYSIVGLTDQLVHERIDSQQYEDRVQRLRQEVINFNPITHHNTSIASLPSPNSVGKPDQLLPLISSSQQYSSQPVLQSAQEYKFMLFRHWSLYDSMFHSWYIASKLGVWREQGQKRLKNLLAKMGFSLKECNQIYTHMDTSLKRLLKTRIEAVAPEYGLDEMTYSSFTRAFGFKCTLSASDAVFAITALLEAGPQVATEIGHFTEWMEVIEEAREGQLWYRNFYIAYDAVNDINVLQVGLDLGMDLQRAIMRQTAAVTQKMSIKTLKNFRYVIIKDGPDLAFFCQPLALSKLSLFLFNAMREIGRANLPLVVAAANEVQPTYLVVGFTGGMRPGELRKNKFGLAFQATAADVSARARHDAFESSVLEINKDDMADFLERLQLHMHRSHS